MTIIEFFNPKIPLHYEAFLEMNKIGVWPKEFYKEYLDELEFENGWHQMLCGKMAILWAEYILERLDEGENL